MTQKYEFMYHGRLRKITVTKQRIVLSLSNALPIHSAPYRAGRKQRELKRAEEVQMKKTGVAKPAVAVWALPIVVELKKDGSLRFCMGHCRLNAVTVRDSYSIPYTDECIDSLRKQGYFRRWMPALDTDK